MNLERPRFLPKGLNPERIPSVPKNFWGGIFRSLFGTFGDPYWWPGESAWEVAVGAVLTQNTAWTNVERALENLRRHGWNDPGKVIEADLDDLASALKSSGYFNVKAKKLKNLALWWRETADSGEASRLTDSALRESLLKVWGIGPETADSIACYAFGRPLFVVDAYTMRIVRRLRGEARPLKYDQIQREAHSLLSRDPMLFNHLHGLLVLLGKEHCRARNPRCDSCPLRKKCGKYR